MCAESTGRAEDQSQDRQRTADVGSELLQGCAGKINVNKKRGGYLGGLSRRKEVFVVPPIGDAKSKVYSRTVEIGVRRRCPLATGALAYLHKKA